MNQKVKRYLATLPERIIRSVVGLGAGVAREVGDVALPRSVRQSRLYRCIGAFDFPHLVDTTLRFLIEQRDVPIRTRRTAQRVPRPAAASQFAPGKSTLTDRLLQRYTKKFR